MKEEIIKILEERLGHQYARQRLGAENDHHLRVFGGGFNFFHVENWYSYHSLIRNTLKLTGLYWRGRKNSERIEVRHNPVRLPGLPACFDGFTLLHISDMHIDMNSGAMSRLIELLQDIDYDICVLTGDYRRRVKGPYTQILPAMAESQERLALSLTAEHVPRRAVGPYLTSVARETAPTFDLHGIDLGQASA